MLSIIRLRSEPYANIELAYFFGSLTLALVNGFEQSRIALVVLGTTTILRRKITLDTTKTNVDALKKMLAKRMGVEVVSVTINEVDYVHETTSVVMRYVADPRTPFDLAPADED